MIVTDLPTTAALNRTAMAVATSAQYGYERNPRVAFGEVSVNNNQPVETTSLQVADRDVIVADHFEDLIVYMDKFPQSRGGFDNREMVYDEIIEQTDRLATNYPEYTDLLKVKRAKMRALGAKGRWDEFDGIAADLELSPVLRERLAERSASKERQVSEKYNKISRNFKNSHYSEARKDIEEFITEHPDDFRTPEMHRMLCHTMYSLRRRNEIDRQKYWDVTNDFIDRQVIPDQVDDVLYNQAVAMLKDKDYELCRCHIQFIFDEYPDTKFYYLLLRLYLETWGNTYDPQVIIEAQKILEGSKADSYEAAIALNEMADCIAFRSPKSPEAINQAVRYQRQILEMENIEDLVGDSHLRTLAAHHIGVYGRVSGNMELVRESLDLLKTMPETPMKDGFIREKIHALTGKWELTEEIEL